MAGRQKYDRLSLSIPIDADRKHVMKGLLRIAEGLECTDRGKPSASALITMLGGLAADNPAMARRIVEALAPSNQCRSTHTHMGAERNTTMDTIATHRTPDHDALCSAWMIARYILQTTLVQIIFVPQGTPADQIEANFVTDVGMKYDCVRLFDHHQDANDETTSATSRVFTRLWSESFTGEELSHLQPLVEWVTNGDWGRNKTPNNLNHLLQGLKLQQKDDAEQAAIVFAAYDHIAGMVADGHQFDQAVQSLGLNDDFINFIKEAIAYRQTMKPKFEECLVYQGEKNGIKMCILVNAPMGLTNHAYDLGFDVVAYLGEPVERDGATLYPRGIVRRNEIAHKVHLGDSVTKAMTEAHNLIGGQEDWIAVIEELEHWFCHPAGFMVGLSDKANSPKLLECRYSTFRDAVQLVFRHAI